MANPNPPPPNERLYFLSVEGEKQGPYMRDELIEAGLEDESLVWFQGCTSWVRAAVLPDLEPLLKAERKARKKLAKERRKSARLPDAGSLTWLARIVLLVHVPGGALYLLSTIALLVAFILWASSGEDGPRPDGVASRIMAIVALSGLIMLGLSVLVLFAELILLAVFVRRCGRVVAVLSPSEKEGSLFREMFEGFSFGLPDIGDMLPGADFPMPVRLVFFGGGLAVVIVILIFLCVFMVAVALIVMAALMVMLFLGVVTIIMVSHIPKVGDGLNRLIEEYKMDVPRVPSRLSYWTGISAFLLILGPLSLPAFVMVPIWVFRTASTASQICEQHRDYVEGPDA
jgi:hypothetical protein